MAKGYPDFFGIPQFPGYYAATFTDTIHVASDNVKQAIHTVTGKGVAYYAQLWCTEGGFNTAHSIYLYVDGIEGHGWGVDSLVREVSLVRPAGLFYTTHWDNVNERYLVEINGPIPFSTSFALWFQRIGTTQITLRASTLCSMVN